MILGRVTGNIYGTIKHTSFEGQRMMIVERIDAKGKALNDYVIAVDSVGSGVGDTVLIVDEGGSARQIMGDSTAPLRAVIAGIVECVTDEA